VACTDPRVTPEEFLGMGEANRATVVRTAGGRVHSALNTLLVLSAVGNRGKKGVIIIVHHTDCGLQTVNDVEIRELLSKGVESADEIEMLNDMKFGSIRNPEESVEEDVQALRENPFFKGMQIMGFVQDTETGLLKEMTWGKSTGMERLLQ